MKMLYFPSPDLPVDSAHPACSGVPESTEADSPPGDAVFSGSPEELQGLSALLATVNRQIVAVDLGDDQPTPVPPACGAAILPS